MNKLITIFCLIPLIGLSQKDTVFNTNYDIISINETGINNLIEKYEKTLRDKDGIDGWRLQIKFAYKRDEIVKHQTKFIDLYPEIPSQITFKSPYYNLTVGNYRTKHNALKIKEKISRHFPGAHPVQVIINRALIKNK